MKRKTLASPGRQNVPRKRISEPGGAAATSTISGNSRKAPQVAMTSSRQFRTASRLWRNAPEMAPNIDPEYQPSSVLVNPGL